MYITSQMLCIFGKRERPNWYFKTTRVQIRFIVSRSFASCDLAAIPEFRNFESTSFPRIPDKQTGFNL